MTHMLYVGPWQGHPPAAWISQGFGPLQKHGDSHPFIREIEKLLPERKAIWSERPVQLIEIGVGEHAYRGLIFWLKAGQVTYISAFLSRVDGVPDAPVTAVDVLDRSKQAFPEVWAQIPDMGEIAWPSSPSEPRSPAPSPSSLSKTERASKPATRSSRSSA